MAKWQVVTRSQYVLHGAKNNKDMCYGRSVSLSVCVFALFSFFARRKIVMGDFRSNLNRQQQQYKWKLMQKRRKSVSLDNKVNKMINLKLSEEKTEKLA